MKKGIVSILVLLGCNGIYRVNAAESCFPEQRTVFIHAPRPTRPGKEATSPVERPTLSLSPTLAIPKCTKKKKKVPQVPVEAIVVKPDGSGLDDKTDFARRSLYLYCMPSYERVATTSIWVEDSSKAACHPKSTTVFPFIFSVNIPFASKKIQHAHYGDTTQWDVSFKEIQTAVKESLFGFNDEDFLTLPFAGNNFIGNGEKRYEVCISSSREGLPYPHGKNIFYEKNDTRSISLIEMPIDVSSDTPKKTEKTRLTFRWIPCSAAMMYLVRGSNGKITRMLYPRACRNVYSNPWSKEVVRHEDCIVLKIIRQQIKENRDNFTPDCENPFLTISSVECTAQGKMITLEKSMYSDACKKLLGNRLELPNLQEKYGEPEERGSTLYWLVELSKPQCSCC